MYFGEPDLTGFGMTDVNAKPEPEGERSSFGEIWEKSRKATETYYNINANAASLEEHYDTWIKSIKDLTGEEPPALLRQNPMPPALLSSPFDGMTDVRRQQFEKWAEGVAKKYPQYRDKIMPQQRVQSSANLLARRYQHELQESLANYKPFLPGGSFLETTIATAGGDLQGMLNDPVNIVAMLAGPASLAGVGLRGVIMMAVRSGAANAAVEAAMQPFVQARGKEIGVNYGLDVAAHNIALAAVFGAGLDAGVRAPVRAYNYSRGRTPVTDDKGRISGWTSEGDVTQGAPEASKSGTDTPENVTETVPDLSQETIARAEQGDLPAIKEVVQKTGLDEQPEVRAIIQKAEIADDFRKMADEVGLDLDDGSNLQKLAQAMRSVADDEEPPPVRSAPLTVPREEDGSVVLYRGEGLEDPNRRQDRPGEWYTTDYKRAAGYAGDAEGARGVFKVRIPEEEIANLRKGLGDDEYLVPKRLDEGRTKATDADAPAPRNTDVDAPLTPMDAVRALRRGDSSLAMGYSGTRRQMIGNLARLSNDAYADVEAGRIKPRIAALVGEFVSDQAKHKEILDRLRTDEITDVDQARRVIGQELQRDTQEATQNALLGVGRMSDEAVAQQDALMQALPDDSFDGYTPEQVKQILEAMNTPGMYANKMLNGARLAISNGQSAGTAAQALKRRIDEVMGEDGIAGLQRRRERPKIDDPAGPGALDQAAELERSSNLGKDSELFSAPQRALGDPEARALTPLALREMPEIRKEINRIIRRLPDGMRVELEDRLVFQDRGGIDNDIDAAFYPEESLIKVSLATNNPARHARHEEMHAYRQLGLLSGEEWNVMMSYAREQGLREAYNIDGRYGEIYGQRFNDPDRLEEALIEETIAEMWADRVGGRTFNSTIDAIIDRIQAFLRQVARALGVRGYLNVDDVYQRIDSGEVGKRNSQDRGLRYDDVSYSFAGPKALNADLDALKRAKSMEQDGSSRDEIWKETGWFRGVDSKWRWEIDDSRSEIDPMYAVSGTSHGQLSDVMIHPDMLGHSFVDRGQYPAIRGMDAEILKREDVSTYGEYDSVHDKIYVQSANVDGDRSIRSTMHHEIQHRIQREEGFAEGYNPASATSEEIERERLRLRKSPDGVPFDINIGKDNYTAQSGVGGIAWIIRTLSGGKVNEDFARFSFYKRHAGEVEARTVQKRLNMTQEERRARPPWLDYDVPEADQFVRFESGEEQMSAALGQAERIGEVGKVVEFCKR